MDIAALLEAVGDLAWPVLAAVVLWKLFPMLQDIARSRGFTIKVGGMEVTVQEVSEQLRTQIEDLQQKVTELRSSPAAHPPAATALVPAAPGSAAPEPPRPGAAAPGSPAPAPAAPGSLPPRPMTPVAARVLWVDDAPANNALEIARLKADGVEVVEATSTAEAIRTLMGARAEFGAVITDMGRKEDGKHRAKAGIELIRTIRESALNVPVFVYCSVRGAAQHRPEVLATGGNGITASPVELFELLSSVLPRRG